LVGIYLTCLKRSLQLLPASPSCLLSATDAPKNTQAIENGYRSCAVLSGIEAPLSPCEKTMVDKE